MSAFTDQDKLIEELKSYVTSLENELKEIKENKSKIMIDAETQYEIFSLVDEFNLYKENNKNNDLSIADMIKETSENYLSDSGYFYDEKTGLYYHNQSGYYYDPINSLFYNPINACYYSYDSDTQEYKFHSQENTQELSLKEQELLWTQGYQHKPPKAAIIEATSKQEKCNLAPCMRLINEKTGHLAIITCSGGSIGSNKTSNHTITLNDFNELEINLRIIYDTNCSHYYISRDVTDTAEGYSMLNDSIITKNSRTIDHHSRLIIKSISFLIHIHEDFGTCDWCEPGQVKEKLIELENNNEDSMFVNKWNKKNVVNQLKIKYKLKGSGNVPKGFWRKPKMDSTPKYIDRALIRRKKEKEDEIKVHEPKNAAMKMMSNMGWNPGESLGKSGTGIIKPLEVQQRLNSRAGIGCVNSVGVPVDTDFKTARKIRLINATQKRYEELCKD